MDWLTASLVAPDRFARQRTCHGEFRCSRDLPESSLRKSSPMRAVPLPGPAPGHCASVVRRVYCSCILRAAEATGAPGAVPPAALAPLKIRRLRDSTFRAAFSSRSISRPHTPIDDRSKPDRYVLGRVVPLSAQNSTDLSWPAHDAFRLWPPPEREFSVRVVR